MKGKRFVKKKIIIQYSVLSLALLIFIVKPTGTFGETVDIGATTETEAESIPESVGEIEQPVKENKPLEEDAATSSEDIEKSPEDLGNAELPSEEHIEPQVETQIETEEGTLPEEGMIHLEALDEEVLDEERSAILDAIMEEQEDLSVSTLWKGQNISQQDLKREYQLTFSEDFADVMSSIEAEYRLEYEIAEHETLFLQATNWQDVIAKYLLQKRTMGETEFFLSMDDKEGLKKIYREMNRVIYVDNAIQIEPMETRVLYQNRIPRALLDLSEGEFRYQNLKVEELIALDQSLLNPVYSEEDQAFLRRYTSEECRILCAGATRAGEFLQQPEEELSRGRQEVLKAAFQAIGKVPYFWGGKSTAIGLDPRIGAPTVVSAGGSTSTGSVRAYGLDCSGFVSWAFVNGAYYSESQIEGVGAGTIGQWAASVGIPQEEAKPGDLVFLASPQYVRGINHVGIVVGRDSEGGLLAIHCNAGDNGVVVESAYSAGFRYVRRPLAFEHETAVY